MTVHLSTLSSDGNAGTPTGSGARYVSMAAWESTAQGQHLAGDQTILECYEGTTTEGLWQADGSLVESVEISGWSNINATDKIAIRAAHGEAHGGVFGAGFRMQPSSGFVILNSVLYTEIEDIAIYGNANPLLLIRADWTYVNRLYLYTTGAFIGVSIDLKNDCVIRNSLFSGTFSESVRIRGDRSTVENCTVIEASGIGFNYFYAGNYDTGTIINCVANNCATGFDDKGGTSGVANNNAPDDGTHLGTAGQTITDADFTNYAGGDYTPAVGGNLDGTGADLSGEFTDDITGQTRTQWDIGAYGIISGAAGFDDTNAFTITIAAAGVTVDPNDLSQSQSLDNVELSQGFGVAPEDIANAQALDNVELSQNIGLPIADLSQGQTIGEVQLVQAGTLAIDPLTQGQFLTNVGLSSAGEIGINDITQDQPLGNVTLSAHYSVTTTDLSQGQLLSNVTISFEGQVPVVDVLQGQLLDNVELVQAGTLQVDDLLQQNLLDVVTFGGLIIGNLAGEVSVYPYLSGDPVSYID